MLDALEKQLKNSKHEDGKLENFICFESMSKAAAAVVVWGGFRRRGGYYGGYVRGGGRAWRVTVGGLCNPRGNPSRRQETEAFVLRLPFQQESKVPPKLCGRLTLTGVPENAPLPFESPLTPSGSPLTPLCVNVLMTFTDYEIQMRNGNVCVLLFILRW